MCHDICKEFILSNTGDLKGKRVLEVGSFNINGDVRSAFQTMNPSAYYVGIDIKAGNGVDIICRAEEMLQQFGRESFDVVIATEVLEHIKDWRTAVSNMKHVLKPHGILLITTRSKGFGYHGYPYDFWRYELSDMEEIFADCVIEVLRKDPVESGVFVKARKPADFAERDLSRHRLHSVLFFTRVKFLNPFLLTVVLPLVRAASFGARFIPKGLKRKIIRKLFGSDTTGVGVSL